MAHVLFMDIVAYSQLPIDEQTRLIGKLQHVVRNTVEFGRAQKRRQLLRLPTGDGMALLFFGDAEAPARCAIEVSRALRDHPELKLRMGVHTGPVQRVEDINANRNVAGGGINIAQRVMDCGDAGHILVSSTQAEVLGHLTSWTAMLHDLGEAEVKHGVRVHLYNLYREDAGNPEVPKKISLALRYQHASETATVLKERQPSIAVLPFANMSTDKDNDHFSDGLAEEIINDLAHLPGMNVAGRTSSFFFRGKDVEFREIGAKLNVEYLLEGSVRKSGNRVRVTAQLIKVSDGFHLWSERYDCEMTDIFAMQDEITQAISETLRIKLSPQAGKRPRREPNLRAYDAYLKARAHWFKGTSESMAQFKESLERAIELDREFALPYVSLCGYYSMVAHLGIKPAREVIPLARAAAEEALRLDPSLPEAHALLGVFAGTFSYDWNEAERRWRLAMAREPISGDVRFWFGNHYLLTIGHPAEAVEAMARGLERDPLNLLYRHHLARGLQHAGQSHEAEGELKKVLELDENFPPALGTLGLICAQQGRFEEALALTERACALMPWANVTAGQLAALLVRTGAQSRADALLKKLRPGMAYGAPTGMAVFHGLCGGFDEAAEWAEQAINERYPEFVNILRPLLQASSRWPALAKRINLPDKSYLHPSNVIANERSTW